MTPEKKSLIIIIISIIVLLFSLTGIFIIIAQSQIKLPVKQPQGENEVEIGGIALEVETISYEGTFKTRGVVVRAEKESLIVMPTVSNNEYRVEEKFLYETQEHEQLKQGQEVEITYHYNETEEMYTYEAVIEKVEILKEKSKTEIPEDIIVNAYSTKDNVKIDINEFANTGINFTITDTNEYKYNYSKMKYDVRKYNPPPTKTEAIETETGMAVPAYDPWPELTKINDISTEKNYQLDENGQIEANINWEEVYGKLEEGKYRITLATVNGTRKEIIGNNTTYKLDAITIQINFEIKHNNEIEIGEIRKY